MNLPSQSEEIRLYEYYSDRFLWDNSVFMNLYLMAIPNTSRLHIRQDNRVLRLIKMSESDYMNIMLVLIAQSSHFYYPWREMSDG